MKKSLFTFGFLASSLVMLGVIPLFNNNAAMAQGNYNYGDSYSTYPTDDNKYECRTGPLEGFFVSSVEFCKHIKFDKDDRKDRDNQTGTQGPPGPAGPQGERGLTGATGMTGPPGEDGTNGAQGPRGFNGTNGAQGLAGLSTINTTNVYTNIGPTVPIASSGVSSIANCDLGDTAISGSFIVSGNSMIRSDKPLITENGWNATALNIGPAGPGSVTADVVCFDNPPAH